jgi:hypothetical protein
MLHLICCSSSVLAPANKPLTLAVAGQLETGGGIGTAADGVCADSEVSMLDDLRNLQYYDCQEMFHIIGTAAACVHLLALKHLHMSQLHRCYQL